MNQGRILYHVARSGRLLLWLVLFIKAAVVAEAQPPNDDCADAITINISGGGFGLGTFTSSKENITRATVQTGETFAPAIFSAGLDQKSVWYKFTLPVKRLVAVTLLQPGSAIQAGDAGFSIYKADSCLPAEVYDKFTPIAKFGTSAFPCVDSGVYLIQVSSKAVAAGEIYIQLYLSDSTGGTVDNHLLAEYDKPVNAHEFGSFPAGAYTMHVDMDVNCQTIDNASEVCSSLGGYRQYTKSTWHTFTTPAYFDYLAVLLSTIDANGNCDNREYGVIGYRLYKGDVKTTAPSGLIPVGGCDSFVSKQYNYADFKLYGCNQLDAGATYTIQLFYKYDFNRGVRLALSYNGSAATKAPEPVLNRIPAGNQFGVLPEGDTKATDYFGCNSRHSLHPCGYSLPGKGVVQDGIRYNLSTFYTFRLSSSANIRINAYAYSPYYQALVRLYKQVPDNNCATLDSAHLLSQEHYSSTSLNCLDAGTYTLQVLGTDSLRTDYTSCGYLGSNVRMYLLSHLGQQMDLTVSVDYINAANKFSLNKKGAYDSINFSGGKLQPLQNKTEYTASPDTFGCANTVLSTPSNGDYCSYTTNPSKAIYRQFVIGDADGNDKADSGVVTLNSLYGYGNGSYMTHVLYRGDADALATAQNKHEEADTITGLTAMTECMYPVICAGNKICVTPGTYTLVTLGNSNHVGVSPYRPTVQFDIVGTMHYSGATAQNMGNILDTIGGSSGTVYSDRDYFSCKDNAVTIDGFAPPVISGDTATKAIYRQFYLSSTSIVNICENYYNDCEHYYTGNTNMALFSGRASGGLTTLKKLDWQFCQSAACNPLAAGWYTVVSYGVGPNYKTPFQANTNSYGGAVGKYSRFYVTVAPGCPGPEFNRPHKAAIDSNTRQPFLLEWKNRQNSTTAYPVTDTTYTLYTEHFNCTVDTPFASYLQPCDDKVNRVAYYVFRINKESYVQISTDGFWAQVFDKDVRKDSSQLATLAPVQPCVQSYSHIQLCNLQPGIYTLVLFAGDDNVSNGCGQVTPTIYIDKTGNARFDHADKAYDFGVIPSDSAYHNGRPGDVNPLNNTRAPSNDFFYCSTGARIADPSEAPSCYVYYDSLIYKKSINNYLYEGSAMNYYSAPRRNLWYTFVIDKPGYVYVKVNNKTPGKMSQYAFAVYKSDVEGNLSFRDVVKQGKVDSTAVQGLTYVLNNHTGSCYNSNEMRFYIEPCSFSAPMRYYVLVENTYDNEPNGQAEVEIMLDSVSAIKSKFDHYYQADSIGKNLVAGTYQGSKDNFMCATADEDDPVFSGYTCAQKTLWYKFSVSVTGHIRYRMQVKGLGYPRGQSFYDYSYMQLLQETVPGDSTKNGFVSSPPTSSPYDPVISNYWGEQCISPGVYYLLLTGCNIADGDVEVYPEIQITEDVGDFCSAPAVAALAGPGSNVSSVTVDCHTIGTDYGEFAPTLSCPAGAKTANYKTSWFRIDITGKDTLDVTAYLDEKTNAGSADIKYRMMTGDCGAMQEQSCVQDALTQNTYRCLAPGSYYIQVFSPLTINGYQQVTGDIKLHVIAVPHADTCKPDRNCLATARFTTAFDCSKDSMVQFTNYSTYGSSISYQWDFGHNGRKSSEVSPAFLYPALAKDSTYIVKLVTTNSGCGKTDSSMVTVKVPARPYVNLGADLVLCNADTTVTLNASSFPGAAYRWQDGSSAPVFTAKAKGDYKYGVIVTYKNCVSADTVNIFINPLIKNPGQNAMICEDSVQLYDYRGYTATYQWNTGEIEYYIFAKKSGDYWVDITYNGCVLRDSFAVSAVQNIRPLGNDTALCLAQSYILNAAIPNAGYYQWEDGSTGPTHTITDTGTYWVDIIIDGCTIRDSIHISKATQGKPVIKGASEFCEGDSTLLDAGGSSGGYLWNTGDTTRTIQVKTGGVYRVTVTNNGCAAESDDLTVTERKGPSVMITGNIPACAGDSVRLDAGGSFIRYNWSSGDTTQLIFVKQSGKLTVAVKDDKGCTGKDSVTVNISPVAITNDIRASLCNGQVYTLPSGKKVSDAGFYIDTVKSISGCDSLISMLELLVNEPLRLTMDTSVCSGQTFILPSGETPKQSGIYIDTLRATSGCDSLINTVHLNIYTARRSGITAVICDGSSYTMPSGELVSKAGIYKDTLRNTAGCDSLITTLDLTVFTKQMLDKETSICAGQTYTLPSGAVKDKTGEYIDTLRGTSGCDSLITHLRLTVSDSARKATIAAFICAGQTYTLPSGKEVNASGIYMDIVKNATGCDSIISYVTLTVFEFKTANLNAAVCEGETYTLPSGKKIKTAGIFNDTLRNIYGCDSLVTTVDLKVSSAAYISSNASICSGGSYALPSGLVVTAPGNYKDTLRSTAGCDSLITSTEVKLIPVTTENKRMAICAGQSYTLPSGKKVNMSGVFRDTLQGIQGCDSLITLLNLYVYPEASLAATSAAICAGQSYTLPSGSLVSQAGVYKDVVPNAAGCDSIITTVSLTVNSLAQMVNANAVICADQTYTLPWGPIVTTAGSYRDTLRSMAGCDSIINTITLSAQPLPVFSITASAGPVCIGDSIKLTATGGDSGYVWSVAGNTLASGPSSIWVHPAETGVYSVYMTDRTCNVSGSTSIPVVIKTAPDIIISKSNDVDCMAGTARLTATGGNSYLWFPAEGLNNPNISNPVAAPVQTTVYHVRVTSGQNCTGEDSITLAVQTGNVESGFPVASAFTPNGDGLNDCFGIRSWGFVTQLNFSVFDRMGYLLFHTTRPSDCWDGTYRNRPMPPGTYVYQVSAKTICGMVYRKGTVVLIK